MLNRKQKQTKTDKTGFTKHNIYQNSLLIHFRKGAHYTTNYYVATQIVDNFLHKELCQMNKSY